MGETDYLPHRRGNQNWNRTWLFFALVASATLLYWVVSEAMRPKWHGKTVEAWLVSIQSIDERERSEAERAIREIGTNAIPTLITYLHQHDSETKKSLIEWMASHRIQLPSRAFLFFENYYHSKASCGFRALGTNGQPAMPSLRLLYDDPSDTGEYAAVSVIYVAPDEARALSDRFIQSTNRTLHFRGQRLKSLLAVERIQSRRSSGGAE